MELNRVMVTTDFSELASTAYGPAGELAGRFGAELYVVHAAESLPPFYYMNLEGVVTDVPKDAYLDDLERRLTREAAERPDLRAANATPRLVCGRSPQGELNRLAHEESIDLAVIATHGRTGLGHCILGSFAEKLLRVLTVPVLVCPKSGATEFPRHCQRVLVPIDFSEQARAVFPAVRLWAREYGCQFTFFHVLPPIPYTVGRLPAAFGNHAVRQAFFEAPDRAHEEFERLRRQELPGVDAEFLIGEGAPASEILRLAANGGYQLAMISTHGWTGFQHLVLGSVAEKFVRQASVPVLTVRPPRVREERRVESGATMTLV